jgi:hypothetical protein
LIQVRNTGIEEDDEAVLIGQPDVGDFAAHDGWHPRVKPKANGDRFENIGGYGAFKL